MIGRGEDVNWRAIERIVEETINFRELLKWGLQTYLRLNISPELEMLRF